MADSSAARTSMADLIARLRRLIGDPAGASTQFTDLELQEILDRHMRTINYDPLKPVETRLPGGFIVWLLYLADGGSWELGEQLVDMAWNPVAPATSDENEGRWTLAISHTPPLYIVGNRYDLYGSAAELLDEWAAVEKLSFDFQEDRRSFARSQKTKAMEELADRYRRRAWPATSSFVRTDLTAGDAAQDFLKMMPRV